MTEKEIHAFWQLPIQLKNMPADDPQRPMLEAAVEDLKAKMLAEMHAAKEELKPVEEPDDKALDQALDQALQLLATTCVQASMLEEKYLKDQIPEQDRKALLQARKHALVKVAEAIGRVEASEK